jgi:exodeoxyribonuclease V alpha subunit
MVPAARNLTDQFGSDLSSPSSLSGPILVGCSHDISYDDMDYHSDTMCMNQRPLEFTAPLPDSAPESVSLDGILDSITFHNVENGFTVARFRVSTGETITLVATFINPTPGEALQLWGHWETHKQFGSQLRVERYQVMRPATAAAIEKYLGSGLIKGIGPQTAKALVRTFGLDTLDIIENAPQRLAEVPGIGKHKAHLVAQAWADQHEVRNIMLFLQGHGISAAYATKIYRTYGDRAVEVVSNNPYQLARDVFGIGFKLADQIAYKIGIAQDTPARIEAGVVYALKQSTDNGHCYLPEDDLARQALGLLTPPADAPARDGAPPTLDATRAAIDRLVRSQFLVRDAEAPDDKPIYLQGQYIMEQALAQTLRGILDEEFAPDWQPEELEEFLTALCQRLEVILATHQLEAVRQSLSARVLILTGGPGTGKTTTTRAILHAQRACGREVLLASPTGRAAKRLAEVTGYPAQTIHRLLEVDPKSFTFKRGPDNPLECDTLIIDEVSMVDLQLAYHLVRALPDGAQLILVGDADQLPSVGAGNVLRDLITSECVPLVRLTEVFRQAAESTIISNAHRVNAGQMPHLVPTSAWQQADCLFISQDDADTAAKKVCDVVGRSLPALGYTKEAIQVLTPMQRGILGAQNLNLLLQATLNPPQLGIAEFTRGPRVLRCGDRVIQVVNNYEKDVFNGDIGYLCAIDAEEKEFVVAYPEKDVVYGFEDGDEIQLAYALTVHKSQGSEYPTVLLVLHTQHFLLLQRNLVYTALTRAKRLAVLLGSKRAISIAVNNAKPQARNTRLAARLRASASLS